MDSGLALAKGALAIGEIVLGVIVFRGGEAWQRIAGALFVLNGLADLDLFWNVVVSGIGYNSPAADIATGPLLILLSFHYPGPWLDPKRLRTITWIGVASAGALSILAFFVASNDLQPISWLTTFPGYALFLTVAVPGALRLGKNAEPGTNWVIAGFSLRMIEFVPAFSFILPRAMNPETFSMLVLIEALTWLWLAFAAARVTVLAVRSFSGPTSRDLAEVIVVAIGAGLLLGIARSPLAGQAIAGEGFTPARNVLARLSVSLLRPLLVAIGVLGAREVTIILVPLTITAAAGALGFIVLPALVGSGFSDFTTILLGVALALIGLALGVTFVRRVEPSPEPGNQIQPEFPEIPVWTALLLALKQTPQDDSEKTTRPQLARRLGVPARNLHRIVEQAEKNGRGLSQVDGNTQLIAWEFKRGRSGQRKYFYSLTPAGESVVERLLQDRATGGEPHQSTKSG